MTLQPLGVLFQIDISSGVAVPRSEGGVKGACNIQDILIQAEMDKLDWGLYGWR